MGNREGPMSVHFSAGQKEWTKTWTSGADIFYSRQKRYTDEFLPSEVGVLCLTLNVLSTTLCQPLWAGSMPRRTRPKFGTVAEVHFCELLAQQAGYSKDTFPDSLGPDRMMDFDCKKHGTSP